MSFGDLKYNLEVRDGGSLDGFSDTGRIESGCLVFVYEAGTKTLATLYSDAARASLANPITRAQFATDDGISFFCAKTSVDITVAHEDGSVGKYAGVTPNLHSLVLDRSGVDKCLIVPFGVSDNVETDTGIDLPVNALIKDLLVEVVTLDAGETLNVGLLSSETAGDADGLLAAISVNAAGFIKPFVNTVGSNETYVSTSTYGVLMGPAAVGTDVNEDTGIPAGFGHIISGSNAKSLTYTGSAGSDAAAGYIYTFFKHLR